MQPRKEPGHTHSRTVPGEHSLRTESQLVPKNLIAETERETWGRVGSSPPCTCHLTWTHSVRNSLSRHPWLRLLLQQGDDSWLWEPMSCSGGDPGSEHLCPGPFPALCPVHLQSSRSQVAGDPERPKSLWYGTQCICLTQSLTPPRSVLTRDPGLAGQSAHCSPLSAANTNQCGWDLVAERRQPRGL